MGQPYKYLLHGARGESVRGHTHLASLGLELGEEEDEGVGACLVEWEEESHLSASGLFQPGTRD